VQFSIIPAVIHNIMSAAMYDDMNAVFSDGHFQTVHLLYHLRDAVSAFLPVETTVSISDTGS